MQLNLKKLSNNKKLLLAAGIVAGIIIIYVISKKGSKSSPGGFKKKLVDTANQEFAKWNKSGTKLKEGAADTLQDLRKYWKEGAGVNNSDSYYINEPWSAAFISYVMKTAGAGDQFKYAPAHSVYIAESVKNRKENNDKKFKAYKPNEVKVEVGDLVCYSRQSGVTYDSPAGYKSHCDLITEISGDTAVGIGGNVSDSVSKKNYPLKGGKIDSSKVFVVIKNLM
jgi:hypothetical protein